MSAPDNPVLDGIHCPECGHRYEAEAEVERLREALENIAATTTDNRTATYARKALDA